MTYLWLWLLGIACGLGVAHIKQRWHDRHDSALVKRIRPYLTRSS